MPTLAQLQAESWWGREVVTEDLAWLGDEMCRLTGQPASAAGDKGNASHLRGSHRSQEWIINSAYCTSRSYTVQSGLTAEQLRHIAGYDWTPGVWGTAENRRRMVVYSGRVIAAMKAGLLPEVREFFGTLDGVTVTGWSNVTNRAVSSDDSHLDHGHTGFDRRQMRNRALMERYVAIAMGARLMILVKLADDPRVWLSDRISRYHVPNQTALGVVQADLKALGLLENGGKVKIVASLDGYGHDVAAPALTLSVADREAITAGLAGLVPSAADVAEAVGDRMAAAARAAADVYDGPAAA